MTNCINCIFLLLFSTIAHIGQSQIISPFSISNSPLPFNTVRCLEYEANTLWIGTDQGLAKFENENEWTVFNSLNSDLWNDDIRAIKADGDSLLWVGTIQGGLFCFDGSNWTNYNPENSGLGDFLVRAIEIDIEGNIWVATTEGVYMYDRSVWSSWTSNDGLLSNNITALCIGESRKFAGSINGGVLYFDPSNNFVNHTIISSGIPDNSALNIEIDTEGMLWFISPAAGLVADQGDGGPWISFNAINSGMPANSLLCLKHGDEGTIYIGSETGGLITKNEASYQQLTTGNSNLTDNHILCLENDSQGNLWAGTFNGGLCKIDFSLAHASSIYANEFHVYPTLVKEDKLIHFSKKITTEITITNPMGYVLQTMVKDRDYLKLPKALNTGWFYLQFKIDGLYYRKKILILKS
ncbi:MAG: two-component regulator propeller domain-containing protein [Crocinitomicaceae bacterium]